ncbi:MAG TPA: lamin tail domain-containing protein [Candidatus Paceibacterota bacterium]|nr:lamin tail domain-containing protein [Candidatus Paceibacterota bacterium]
MTAPFCRRARALFLIVFIFAPCSVFAAVEITHVEYDVPGSDDGREWVEITNKGAGSVDVSKLKFREGGVNHKLAASSGSATLAAGASAVIAQDPATYLSEHPAETRTVLKSSFSLSNEGEALAIVDADGKTESSMSYTAPPKPAPAPASKKTSSKSAAAKTSASKNSSAAAAERVFTDPETLTASVSQAGLPPVFVWGAAAAGIMALGIAGAVAARLQRKPAFVQPAQPGDEFEIVP